MSDWLHTAIWIVGVLVLLTLVVGYLRRRHHPATPSQGRVPAPVDGAVGTGGHYVGQHRPRWAAL
jgi:hypothetical protein